MKKAKIFLTAITVLTLIGGVFALKATRINHVFFKADTNGSCTIPILATYTTRLEDAVSPVTFLVNYATVSGGPCPITVYKCL